jgi:hypothetical protein
MVVGGLGITWGSGVPHCCPPGAGAALDSSQKERPQGGLSAISISMCSLHSLSRYIIKPTLLLSPPFLGLATKICLSPPEEIIFPKLQPGKIKDSFTFQKNELKGPIYIFKIPPK